MKARDLALVLGILGLVLTWFWCLRGTHAVNARPAALVKPTPAPQIEPAPVPAPRAEPVAPAVPRAAPALAAPRMAPAPAAPRTAPAPAAANLALSYAEDGKVLLEGAVNSDAEKARLVNAAHKRFGAQRVIDQLSVDASLDAIGSVTLTGTAASEAAKQSANTDARQIFGATAAIDNQLNVAPAPPAVQAQQRKLSDALFGKTVEFESGSALLTRNGMTVLDALVPIMQEDTSTRIEVQGHTDDRGLAGANKVLSQRRATTALDYLVSKGVEAQRLAARGFGQEQPIADNGTLEGRQQNRRIEFLVEERN
jgi:OmpA-OmpF porin, OOP family